VDEEFEVVSTQLLKRTQAMLNKYRLLLLEESRRVSPSAEMVMIDRMFIQEEKTTLALDKQLAKEKPDEYVSSSRAPAITSSSSSSSSSSSLIPVSGTAPIPEPPRAPPAPPPPLPPTKLVIKHGGASPSVTWAKAAPAPSDGAIHGDEDALPSRSKPPIKTYEARSRIGLKLKIKQEAGLSKVVHNTALDPVHQPGVIRAPGAAVNGSMDHAIPRKPAVASCRLPLRKSYRENVDVFPREKGTDPGSKSSKGEQIPAGSNVKREDGSRSVITSHRSREKAMDEGSKLAKADESSGGLLKELEEDFYHGMLKAEPPDQSSGPELPWEAPFPAAKRRKSECLEVDNASFSSDSPQDDALNEHLQSAIDSILNLQQHPGASQSIRTPSSSYNSSSSPFSSPVHRTDTFVAAPNHNGGLGARTLTR
ncbi:BICRA protein, partial [Probosciger aterrimus]|nr:BICRA protein [Probosciger aterrimus]